MADLTTIHSDPPAPEGMIRLPSGLDMPDDGFSRLVQVYEEAYELSNEDVLVSIVGREPFRMPLTAFRHTDPVPRIVIADDVVVVPGGLIEDPRWDGNGTVTWCGGHVIDRRRTVRFNLDGRAATFVYDDPLDVELSGHSATASQEEQR